MVIKTKRVDAKHVIVLDSNIQDLSQPADAYTLQLDIYLAKRLATGALDRIPEDEPVIVFRGRDRLALPTLLAYRQLCVADGCTETQIETMDGMIAAFHEFSYLKADRMKQPGITRGR